MLSLRKKMEAKISDEQEQDKASSTEYSMPKQPSKELGELRAKQTASAGAFSIKKGPRSAAVTKKNAAEIRAQKGSYFVKSKIFD